MPGRALWLAFVLKVETATLHSSFASPRPCSKSSGSAALLALSWTCLLVRIAFPSRAKRQGDIWNKLVGSMSLWSSDGQLSAQSWDIFKHILWPSALLILGAGDQAL